MDPHHARAPNLPEGRHPTYSSYGYALAGYVVERLSGETLLPAFDTAAVIGIVAFVSTGLVRWNSRLDPLLLFVYVCSWILAAGSLFVATTAVRFRMKRSGTLWLRLRHTLLAASALHFAWFSIVWRIAGIILNY
ncbi:MAG: hypothetical protein KGN84_16915 [Acidobacteriota bacterium]|nr:hypothetical protein [Acidobacteriota bacterium]